MSNMRYIWYSRMFAILDFLWCTFITSAATCFSFIIIGYLVAHFKYRKEDVVAIILILLILCFCYLRLISTSGLILVTAEDERESECRIRWCIFWVFASWISISTWAIYFLHKIFVPTSWHILDVLFVSQLMLRMLAVYCVNKYILELKADIRRSAYGGVLIPLSSIHSNNMSSTNEVSVFSIGGPRKMHHLPNYEELIQNDEEKPNDHTRQNPPVQEAVVVSDNYF